MFLKMKAPSTRPTVLRVYRSAMYIAQKQVTYCQRDYNKFSKYFHKRNLPSFHHYIQQNLILSFICITKIFKIMTSFKILTIYNVKKISKQGAHKWSKPVAMLDLIFEFSDLIYGRNLKRLQNLRGDIKIGSFGLCTSQNRPPPPHRQLQYKYHFFVGENLLVE